MRWECLVDQFYNDFINNNEKINSQNNYKKDIIFQQIKLDMQRKILIERELDKYRDLIFTDNISEINNIYNIYISYISIDKDTKEKLENLLNKNELENILEVKRLLDENNFSDANITLNKGTKIAQLILYPHVKQYPCLPDLVSTTTI